jgi:hypothetical protein
MGTGISEGELSENMPELGMDCQMFMAGDFWLADGRRRAMLAP